MAKGNVFYISIDGREIPITLWEPPAEIIMLVGGPQNGTFLPFRTDGDHNRILWTFQKGRYSRTGEKNTDGFAVFRWEED
jgi:hypothetical protein